MFTRRHLLCVIVLAAGYGLFAQESPHAFVQVTGAVKKQLTLTGDLQKMPRASAKTSHNSMETTYEGVRLHEVLKAAGAATGSGLRGKAVSSYVLAEAQDGYQALFSLAELDPSFVESEVLLADTANGKPLFGAQGRFRLIAPKDKPGARSVRMLTKLEVVQVRK